MKNLIFIAITFLSSVFDTNAQIKKEVDNGLFVTFPINPEYKTVNTDALYTGKSSNCLFMVIIKRNIIPNYAEYVIAKQNWSANEAKEVEDALLDNMVKGKLLYTGNEGNISKIKIGNYNGRQIEYSAINPATGERGKRFSQVFFVRNNAITFEVLYLKDDVKSNQEKDVFFNSIQTP